jgi:hypothetical protein
MNLLTIPSEMRDEIFQYLPDETLLHVSQTCSLLYEEFEIKYSTDIYDPFIEELKYWITLDKINPNQYLEMLDIIIELRENLPKYRIIKRGILYNLDPIENYVANLINYPGYTTEIKKSINALRFMSKYILPKYFIKLENKLNILKGIIIQGFKIGEKDYEYWFTPLIIDMINKINKLNKLN